ncbi:MAG: heterocyst frequency control protein PatD [Halothece sp. Uz-M2-17]|nr:heterocyst frequency control protein PatD [Halothece sp. Uz-M2-17]
MLPLSYRERYQHFLDTLKQLQEHLKADVNRKQLNVIFSQLQQEFEEEIMSLTGEELTGEILPRWQSSQTEVHRMMRLLQNDMMFLQTSRNSNTSQHRLTTVRDRVGKLIDFADALTKE